MTWTQPERKSLITFNTNNWPSTPADAQDDETVAEAIPDHLLVEAEPDTTAEDTPTTATTAGERTEQPEPATDYHRDETMTDNTNSTDDSPTTTTAPAPKLHGDLPRARPHLADSAAAADADTETEDGYVVAARGPYAGVVRFDLAAPAALFHVVEHEQGRYVTARHRDDDITDEVAERMADHFALFFDLDHPAMQPGTLVGIYENLERPEHGGGHLAEAFGVIGPAAALDVPETGEALEARDREHADRRESAPDDWDPTDHGEPLFERLDPRGERARQVWEYARRQDREKARGYEQNGAGGEGEV